MVSIWDNVNQQWALKTNIVHFHFFFFKKPASFKNIPFAFIFLVICNVEYALSLCCMSCSRYIGLSECQTTKIDRKIWYQNVIKRKQEWWLIQTCLVQTTEDSIDSKNSVNWFINVPGCLYTKVTVTIITCYGIINHYRFTVAI